MHDASVMILHYAGPCTQQEKNFSLIVSKLLLTYLAFEYILHMPWDVFVEAKMHYK